MYSTTEQPAYLQGTQTGSILQGVNNLNQANTSYVPGQGSAPTAAPAPTVSSDPNALYKQYQAALAGGQTLGSFENYFAANYKPGGTMSVIPTPGGAGTTSTSGGTTTSTGGIGGNLTGDAWMNSDQMRAELNGLPSLSGGTSAGGSGGGGGGSSVGGSAGGGTGGLGLGTSPTGGTVGGLNSSQYQTGTPLTYNSPGTNTYGQTGTNANGQAANIQMQAANPQSAMAAYQNTPGYQMLGNDQTNQYQQSPGYQYAVSEAMKQVQNGASSRGLLESGSALRAMTDRAQGMAQQDYGNWWNRQNQLYSDYQNRLAGLAGGNTGSQNAMTLGQAQAANTTQTGSNIASLFGNQGNTGMGGIINTGAAQSSNMTNAGAQQAMVQQANASTQLAGATVNQGLF